MLGTIGTGYVVKKALGCSYQPISSEHSCIVISSRLPKNFEITCLTYLTICQSVLRIRDLGSGAFLTPGSGIQNRFFPDPGSRIPDPNPIFFRAELQFFG
jgi:hypothetical protein